MISATRIIMNMPIHIQIVDLGHEELIEKLFEYFHEIDERFSPYKETSEVNKINSHQLNPDSYSEEMKKILELAEKTKIETNGYFDVNFGNKFNPSGIVKGWAIKEASEILDAENVQNYFVDVGGDIQTKGLNPEGKKWAVGIKNPFNTREIVKVAYLSGEGIATSGNYIRGEHIINPKTNKPVDEIASITVISADITDADRMATAAFVMGEKGIEFIEKLKNYEGFLITKEGIGISTSNFDKYTIDRS